MFNTVKSTKAFTKFDVFLSYIYPFLPKIKTAKKRLFFRFLLIFKGSENSFYLREIPKIEKEKP